MSAEETTETLRDDWGQLAGTTVEIRRHGRFLRTGVVELTTEDSNILWLAHDGVEHRTIIDKSDGYEVWIRNGP